jgi:hypothetical protein
MRSSNAMTVSNRPIGTGAAYPTDEAHYRRFRPVLLVPAIVFARLAIAFGVSLYRDPSVVPSVLIGRPVPAFNLPPVKGRNLGLSTADLKGEVSLSMCSRPGVFPAARSIRCSCG